MPLQAGWLDRRVSVYRPTSTRDGFGQVAGTPALVGTFSAAYTPASDAERLRAGEMQATVEARFLVRWSGMTTGIDPTCSLVFEGVTYNILAAKEALSFRGVALGRREALEISATARAEQAG